jgi:hypothetical protein
MIIRVVTKRCTTYRDVDVASSQRQAARERTVCGGIAMMKVRLVYPLSSVTVYPLSSVTVYNDLMIVNDICVRVR